MNRLQAKAANAAITICVIVLLAIMAWSIQAWLGFSQTAQATPNAASDKTVLKVTPTPNPTVVTQGFQEHKVSSWNTNYKGHGVKVGIIDFGFEGISSLQGNELPAFSSTQLRCYPNGNSPPTKILTDCEHICTTNCPSSAYHGTPIAEIINDIAPEAELYISNAATATAMGTIRETVDWMAKEGVDIINYSANSTTLNGPGNGVANDYPGSDNILKVIEKAVNTHGIVWVNSAGNFGMNTWYGTDNNTRPAWHYFQTHDRKNNFTLGPNTTIHISLRWQDDWDDPDCNFNLYLYSSTSSIPIRSSSRNQMAPPHPNPYREIFYTTTTGGDHSVSIFRSTCSDERWLQMRVVNVDGSLSNLQYKSTGHHIGIPEEINNAGMVAVAAAAPNMANTLTIKDYSNKGPALIPKGRVKPGITGMTDAMTKTNSSFTGTSAAAPHIAGIAALVIDRNKHYWGPNYKPRDVVDYIKATAERKTGPSPNNVIPNNIWGYGFAELPDPPPAASIRLVPSSIQKNTGRTLSISANFTGPDGVRIETNNRKLALQTGCINNTRTPVEVLPGNSFVLNGCYEGTTEVRLYKKGTNALLRTYNVTVTASSSTTNPNPPASPGSPRPPTNLRLSKVAGEDRELSLDYTRSESPHYYEFALYTVDFVPGEDPVFHTSEKDRRPPETFRELGWGYAYSARGRNCRSSTDSSTCGAWSEWSNTVELSNPQIAITSLPSTVVNGKRYYFSATASNYTHGKPYTVVLDSNNSSIGFNPDCTRSTSSSFASTANRTSIRAILYACGTAGGTIAARLREGNSAGPTIRVARMSLMAIHDAELNPEPKIFNINDLTRSTLLGTFSSTTPINITVSKTGDTGKLSLNAHCDSTLKTQGIYYKSAIHGDSVIAIKACRKGRVTIRLYETNTMGDLLKVYSLMVDDNATLTPIPATITNGSAVTFTLGGTFSATQNITIRINRPGDDGRLSFTNTCNAENNTQVSRVKNGTITLKGCTAGPASIRLFKGRTLLKTYELTVE